MKKPHMKLFILSLIPVFLGAQQAEWEWVQQAGDVQHDIGEALTADDDGNVLFTGYFYYQAIFEDDTLASLGKGDIYLAKYDSDGSLCWVRQSGGENDDCGHDVTVDQSGNIYLTGSIGGSGLAFFGDTSLVVNGNTDIFLAKYDNLGNFLWVRMAGGSFNSYYSSSWDCGRSVVTDSENNVFVTGSFMDTALFQTDTLFSYGELDLFLAKYNENGDLLWVENYGSVASDNGNTLVVDEDDNLCLAGWFEETITIADTFLIPHDGMDNFILKLDNSGERIWIKQIGGSTAYTYKTSIALDIDNNIYVTDYFSDTINLNDTMLIANGNGKFYLSKYDQDGGFIWAKQYFDVGSIQGYSLTMDTDNNLYVIGTYNGVVYYQNSFLLSPYGFNDIFVAKFDGDGNFIWILSAGSTNSDMGKDIIWSNNNVYITGWFENEATFGNTTITNFGIYDNRDIYVAKIKENPVQTNHFIDLPSIRVFPNPNNGVFSLKKENITNKTKIEILNINGRILFEKNVTTDNEKIDITKFPSGIYFIRVISENNSITEKLVKY